MGFLRKLLNREPKAKAYVDERGIYFDVICGKCESSLKIRADRSNDLTRSGNDYLWRKTIVCDSCFHRMDTRIMFNSKKVVKEIDTEGGTVRPSAL